MTMVVIKQLLFVVKRVQIHQTITLQVAFSMAILGLYYIILY